MPAENTMSTARYERLALPAWLLVTFIASAIGALGSANAPAFYAELTQPVWAPPAWLFGPVWTLLYAMMGIAAWLVWREGGWALRGPALRFYLVQLAFNAAWSWVFFAAQLGMLAFITIAILLLLVMLTSYYFWRATKLAGLLLLPYLAWLLFAAALNLTLWQQNPSLL